MTTMQLVAGGRETLVNTPGEVGFGGSRYVRRRAVTGEEPALSRHVCPTSMDGTYCDAFRAFFLRRVSVESALSVVGVICHGKLVG